MTTMTAHAKRILPVLFHIGLVLLVLLSSVWLCMALWVQQPVNATFSYLLISVWITLVLILSVLYATHKIRRNTAILIYAGAFLIGLAWYICLIPQQHRQWNPEVARLLNYEQHGDLVTLHNVRNFAWQNDGSYIERWESRSFDLNQISGVNVITSYWMGPAIAHTLVSFDFYDRAPLTFSIEIRKEQDEDFSALGGFFRKYEITLVAADEKDIVYTRSNIRGEQVYFFPIQMQASERRALFEEYLHIAHRLYTRPRWYNTLTSNCTTLVFDMAQAASHQRLPSDYRLIASGYLPNYLHDLGVLTPKRDMVTWYQLAHINPKSRGKQLTSSEYSALLRQGVTSP